MNHYLDNATEVQKKLANANQLIGPLFVGQGASEHVGSDCYGYYVTKLDVVNGKLIVGMVEANSKFDTTWEAGSQTCTMPEDTTPSFYLRKFYGKWCRCDSDGAFPNGVHSYVRFSWNGAYAYQDPSF